MTTVVFLLHLSSSRLSVINVSLETWAGAELKLNETTKPAMHRRKLFNELFISTF